MKAQSFTDILKFNPHHDRLGRFSSADGAASFTYAPGKSKAHDMAIAREKERLAATGEGFQGTLYHGSPNKDIDEFDINRAGQNTSSGEKLLYFTDSKEMADDFSYERLEGSTRFTNTRGEKGRVYEVEVTMIKPLDFRNLSDSDIDNILKLDEEGLLTREDVMMLAGRNHQLLKANLNLSSDSLQKLGYDGFIANTGKAGHNSTEYAVISSGQTKIIKNTDDTQQFNVMKTDDDKRLIFGWASVAIRTNGEQVVDWQNDIIDPEDLEDAVYSYVLNFRDSGEEHIPNLRKKGRLVESCMFTKEKMQAMGIPEGIVPEGWWIGFYIDDDEAWEKVKNGTYKMFSVEGKGIREEVEDDEDEEVKKFNPYHGKDGRFTSANGRSGGTASAGSNKKQWNYPGITEAVNNIEREVSNVKSHKKAADLYQAIKQQQKVIDAALKDIKDGVEDGNADILLANRRTLIRCNNRLLRSEVLGKGITTVAKTFSEALDDILKFNPYHDERGRFASANNYTSFTIRTRDPSKQHMANMAIAREKEREAAGVSGGTPPKKKENETPQEKKERLQGNSLKESLANVENEHRDQNFETLSVVDKSGNILILKDGQASCVVIERHELMQMRDAVVTHNHPSSSCFSVEDIRTFVKSEATEMRATRRDGGAYSVRKANPDSYDWNFVDKYNAQMRRATNRAQNKLDEAGFAKKIMSGEITQAYANQEMRNLINADNTKWLNRYAGNYGYVFTVE